jgi:hypothetical protein
VSALQENPHILEIAYDATRRALGPVQGWLVPGGRVERLFIFGERLTKGPIFDCRMCGQCVLHQTGMTCPMTCPKEMRNGPCGGVRPDGRCEVLPDMACVWTQAWERSKRMPVDGREILEILPPVDRRLKDSSAWINDVRGTGRGAPSGWDE